MKKKVIIGVSILGIIAIFWGWYFLALGKIGVNEDVEFTINNGTTTNKIITNLKTANLIKSPLATKIYLFFHPNGTLMAGVYHLSRNMSTVEIINKIKRGDIVNDNITITFVEGKKVANYISLIANNFNISEDEITNTLNDKTYLTNLINKYWFLSDEILNSKLYYPLEGYLYPDTYEFKKDATLDEIITKMLDNTNDKLSAYAEAIQNSNYSYHQLLTLASIVELEAQNSSDRKGVAGVMYNRLNNGWSLGSDVTAYYGVKKNFGSELTQNDLADCNAYNTRSTCLKGLPVGPICNPGLESILASLYPTTSDYYFFVADTNSKVYFSKTAAEQANVIATLKEENLWYNY
jgi:UPF0755 protein